LAVSDDLSFPELIRRVRARDEQAAADLVRRYEPAIRVAVRVRLSEPALRRAFDSMDIWQSVLANFFVRAALGQFELDKPEQLLALLATMARNKVTNYVKKQRAARRDYRRLERGDAEERALAAPGPSPSQLLANRELLQAVHSRLSAEERQLAEQRALGRSWAEIAAEAGERPDTLRLRLARALDRVATALRLDD
jgi:RNA polymerase sigma-70 factor (ECF subfamily)